MIAGWGGIVDNESVTYTLKQWIIFCLPSRKKFHHTIWSELRFKCWVCCFSFVLSGVKQKMSNESIIISPCLVCSSCCRLLQSMDCIKPKRQKFMNVCINTCHTYDISYHLIDFGWFLVTYLYFQVYKTPSLDCVVLAICGLSWGRWLYSVYTLTLCHWLSALKVIWATLCFRLNSWVWAIIALWWKVLWWGL